MNKYDIITYITFFFVFVVPFLIVFTSPVYALTNSTIQCIDNTTLEENITVYVDGNTSTLSLYDKCSNGCDNITGSCRVPQSQENIIALIIFCVIMFFVAKIYKWFRR